MHIGINARGLSVELGGVTTVLEHLLPRLIELDPQNHYTIFHGSEKHRGSFKGATEVFFKAPGVFCWENIRLPLILRRYELDLLFCPKNLVPWFIPAKLKTAIMVYDLLYFRLGHINLSEYQWADVLYMRLFMKRSTRRADRIIACSENTKRDLVHLFNMDPGKITSVYLGVVPPPTDRLTENHLQEVRRKYNLTKPYIFHCGTLSPRKNVVRMLEAFARISSQIPHDFVVTAGKSWKDDDVFKAIEQMGLSGRFRKLGNVPKEDLPALYRMADVLFYASLYEGFGLPILEAMACGCPVITSDTSSMPEVAGDAALLIDPENVPQMAEKLLNVLTDKPLAENLRRQGYARKDIFNWADTAKRIIGIFNSMQGV